MDETKDNANVQICKSHTFQHGYVLTNMSRQSFAFWLSSTFAALSIISLISVAASAR